MDQRGKKRAFGIAAAIFLGLLLYASYDISTRTTFPGSRPQLKERIEERFGGDEPPADTLKHQDISDDDSLSNVENN